MFRQNDQFSSVTFYICYDSGHGMVLFCKLWHVQLGPTDLFLLPLIFECAILSPAQWPLGVSLSLISEAGGSFRSLLLFKQIASQMKYLLLLYFRFVSAFSNPHFS